MWVGRSWASLPTCTPTSQAVTAATTRAATTTISTDGTRRSPRRCTSVTNGVRMKLSSTASEIGTRTGLARYNVATIRTSPNSVVTGLPRRRRAGLALVEAVRGRLTGMVAGTVGPTS